MINVVDDINTLPSIEEVKKRSQGLALLDAILMPEWEYRYFSFNANWDGHGAEMMASMRDGSGREYFLHFSNQGVVGKVLAIENILPDSSSFLSNVPARFSGFINESAFSFENATFFFWREEGKSNWLSSPNNLKSFPLLEFLVGGADSYIDWANEYYERDIDADVLNDVFNSLSVTQTQLNVLNPDIAFEDLFDDLHVIMGN